MPAAQNEHDSADEGLFEEFLERALTEAIDPAAFCAERGLGEPPAWLLELHGMVARSNPVAPVLGGKPQELGDYLLVRQLGEGGMGVVYLAEDRRLQRHVAVKVVRPELSGSPTALQRFEREARALARLRHPGIAAVHAYGEADGVRFLAMELILGRDLDEVLGDGPLEIATAARIALDLAKALAAAHAAGVLHRDIKPANARIDTGGRTVLMDFGLAREVDGGLPTLTSAFAGSPAYAAPEQLTGARPVDARTDVYGLGATLYELLTGRVPFAGDSVDQIMRCVLSEDPTPPGRLRPEVPRDLEAVVLRALERAPDRRYQSMTEFAADLEAWLRGRAVRARTPGPWRRARGWVRSHRVAAAMIAVVVLTATVGAGTLAVESLRLRRERGIEAQSLVVDVRQEMQRHGEVRQLAAEARRKLRALNARLVERPLNAGEEAARARFTVEAGKAIAEREAVFARILPMLTRAQGLDANAAELRRAWAELHYHQWLDLREIDPGAAALHFDRVRELDAGGDLAAEVLGVQRVALLSEPAGAEVHLFRWRSHREVVTGGESRLVPVGPGDEAPRELVLRVESDSNQLRRGDYVTAVEGRSPASWLVRSSRHVEVDVGAFWTGFDGGEPRYPVREDGQHDYTFAHGGQELTLRGTSLAMLGVQVEPCWQFLRKRDSVSSVRVDVLRGDELLGFEVRPPIDVVPTRSAFVPTAATAIGSTPRSDLVLEPGAYLAVLRLPGYCDCRLPFHVDHSVEHYSRPRTFAVTMTKQAVSGFAHVPGEAYGIHKYFLQRDEVTIAQYREFVQQQRDPMAWMPQVAGADDPLGSWSLVDGRVVLPADTDPELPVTGVSWAAARRFAAWYPGALGLDSRHWYGALPAFGHLTRAGHGGDARVFVHGNYFHPGWIKSRHATWRVGPEVGLSYPNDESPFGVFDLQGSVAEWATDLKNPISAGTRIVFGGSWADAEPFRFRLQNYRAVPPEAGQRWIGFRIMLLERDDG